LIVKPVEGAGKSKVIRKLPIVPSVGDVPVAKAIRGIVMILSVK
jgi:hypothetical protein